MAELFKQMIVRNKIVRFCALLVATGVFAIGAAQEAGWPQISERSTATRYLGISAWRFGGLKGERFHIS